MRQESFSFCEIITTGFFGCEDMKQTIYIDILICLNLFVNFFILLCVGRFTKIIPKKIRLFLGSIIGAIGSLIILLPEINVFLNFLIKILLAFLMIFATFGKQSIKTLIKNICAFVLISIAFGGCMIALWFLITPKGMIIHNGIVYFNLSPIVLIISTVICYFIIRIIFRVTGKETPKLLVSKIELEQNGQKALFYVKVDTGNSLVEPFSKSPVIVTDIETLKDLVPKEIKYYFEQSHELSETTSKKVHLRLIPYRTIGTNGILPSFKAEQIRIDGKEIKKSIYIAVCKGSHFKGECRGILNPMCTDNE